MFLCSTIHSHVSIWVETHQLLYHLIDGMCLPLKLVILRFQLLFALQFSFLSLNLSSFYSLHCMATSAWNPPNS